eukprot:g3653.t1
MASLVLNLDEDDQALHEATSDDVEFRSKADDTARTILTGEEQKAHEKSGFLLKMSSPMLLEIPCLPECCGCRTTWKKRYWVLRGGFLFRFSDVHGRAKGVPIAIKDAHIGTIEYNDFAEDPSTLIQISTMRKDYILRAMTRAKRDEWIEALRLSREHAIKVGLGHAKMTKAERRAHRKGSDMFRLGLKRDRQREKDRLMFGGALPGGEGYSI